MAIEAAAYEAITCLRYTVPYASERGYIYFPSRAAPDEAASFPGGRIERDPVLVNLVQFVIAQERMTQRVMCYLQRLADLNPQVAIGRPPEARSGETRSSTSQSAPSNRGRMCPSAGNTSSGPSVCCVCTVDAPCVFISLAFLFCVAASACVLQSYDE